jgi:hypothetical protein
MKVYYTAPEYGNELMNKVMALFYECWAYKIRWALRSIEESINQEGGIITIEPENEQGSPRIDAQGFSEETTEKIQGLIGKEDLSTSSPFA